MGDLRRVSIAGGREAGERLVRALRFAGYDAGYLKAEWGNVERWGIIATDAPSARVVTERVAISGDRAWYDDDLEGAMNGQ